MLFQIGFVIVKLKFVVSNFNHALQILAPDTKFVPFSTQKQEAVRNEFLFHILCLYAAYLMPGLVGMMGFHTYNLDRTVDVYQSAFYNAGSIGTRTLS